METVGSTNKRYFYGLDLVAGTSGTTATTNYLTHDAHGSVALTTNSSGTAVNPYEYDAFGNLLNAASGDTNPFRYSGEYFDSETGNYYLRARYYAPSAGRFISEDSVKDGINWYIYCYNIPTHYIDPTGNAAEDITRIIARSLIANPLAIYATQQGLFSTLFYMAGFVRDADGIYHARQDAVQQIGGYNDFYDTIFYYATSMDSEKFEFASGNRNYVFWAWKGDYLNLGAGAELGIYSNESGIAGVVDITSPIDRHWLVDTNLAMKMTVTLTDNSGKQIFSYSPIEKQWWVTGFNPYYQYAQASELTAIYTVTFNTQTMYNDFYNFYGTGEKKDDRWTFDATTFTATLKF